MDEQIKNCWSTIGVWGAEDEKCPRLDDVLHCRNCDVYSNAGRSLLTRAIPEDYQDYWTSLLAREKTRKSHDSLSIVVFRLGDEWLGLPTITIKEISEIRPVHGIPNSQNLVVKGLVNVRGELKLWVSMGRLLSVDKGGGSDTFALRKSFLERLVIFVKDGEQFVFPVSEIIGTHRIWRENIREVPATAANSIYSHLAGLFELEGRNVGLLDEELLFNSLQRNLV
ncbi:MAG: chemotaxis protein CheW [Gammaproteobacteria bacterium]|nr:chemotaxis protein CheW [Gammaproteobacteria bacterium]